MKKNENKVIDREKVRCKVFFTHAFEAMVMGYVDLGVKLAEILIYVLVLLAKGIMYVFPWRKKLLDEKLKEGNLSVN